MKNIKKVLSLVLALMMVFSITCTTAFAAEDNDHLMPEGLVGTTIAVTVEPGEDAGIMPLIWDQKSTSVGANSTTTTDSFTVPERYFAYECSATGGSGGCKVELYSSNLRVASKAFEANGIINKVDWIDLSSSNTSCYFKITNATNSTLTVKITYYSWA